MISEDGQGGFGYKLPDSGDSIGQFKAFLMGLPSVWNRWILIALMVLVPVAFLWPTLVKLSFPRRRESSEQPTLSLYHRSLCILFAYIFLIGPEVIQTLAYTDTQYHQLSIQAWRHPGDCISYAYDKNGSLIYKIYWDCTGLENMTEAQIGAYLDSISAGDNIAYDHYEYNLQNHLSKLTQFRWNGPDWVKSMTEYQYDPSGIRISAYFSRIESGQTDPIHEKDVVYLIDPANHTGYAQVLEERTTSYNTSDVPTTQNRIHYTIGDDIISQTKSDWTWNTGTSTWTLSTPYDTEYLLYDGQGSTRQLVRPNKTVIENYNYDSYGVMLGGNPTATAQAATKLLYTGEQFDTAAQNYYLRARYYDPMNGRFTQMDTFAGDTQSPQSLHKYTYCHNDPVNYIDPSGETELLAQVLTVGMIIAEMFTAMIPFIKLSLVALTLAATICIIHDLTQLYMAAGMTEVAEKIRSNTNVVKKAINDVAKKLNKTVRQLQKFRLFPIIRSYTPNIFTFDVLALATHPQWFKLTYVGAGPIGTATETVNRAAVKAKWGYLMLVAPKDYQLDEFPYARTTEGGFPALACPVPQLQNSRQGGLFGNFCRWVMCGIPGPFIVVPIPL